VAALAILRAVRDYASICEDLNVKQELLNIAGFTSQIFNPQSAEEEYNIDELLHELSQWVVTLVKKVLQYHTTYLSNIKNNNNNNHNSNNSNNNGNNQVDGKNIYRSMSYSTLQMKPAQPRLSQMNASLYEPNATIAQLVLMDGDVNIWDEPQKEGVNVVFVEGEVVSKGGERPIRLGTLNQLVTRLTNENKPDLTFVKTFITTYQSITTPEVVLNKIIQRYQVPVTEDSQEWRNQKLLPIQWRVYNVLRIWLDLRWQDFDEALLGKLVLFMNECLRKDGHAKLADQLAGIIAKKQQSESKKRLSIPSRELSTSAFWKRFQEFFVSLDEEELARQLTLLEFDTYRSIQPVELLNQAWNKQSLRHRAPHVSHMIARFNSISYWVAKLVIAEEKIRQRTKVMSKILRFAQNLYKENNLNSLLAVMAGLNNSAVHRLKFTSDELSSKDQESVVKFGELLSSEKGYKNYRARVHNINPPLLPYLGVYLTDLTFLEDGNLGTVDGLINFKKREMIFNVIAEIQQYQQTPYKIDPVENYISYLVEIPLVEDTKAMDNELYELSLQREPRNAVRADIL